MKADDNVRESKDVGRGPREELSFPLNNLTTLETVKLKVWSNGWKSTTHRAMFDAPPATLENSMDWVPTTPGCTHNRIRSLRWTAFVRWNNVGKGSRQNGSITLGKGLALRLGHGVLVLNVSAINGLLELPSWQKRVVVCRPGNGLWMASSRAFLGCQTVNLELAQTRGIWLFN